MAGLFLEQFTYLMSFLFHSVGWLAKSIHGVCWCLLLNVFIFSVVHTQVLDNWLRTPM